MEVSGSPGCPLLLRRADRELKLAWPSAIRPIGLRDEPIELCLSIIGNYAI